MRIWTLHPKYLDSKGLVAAWREALLAQKVLRGKTKGYRHHPQLIRFIQTHHPVAAIASYLEGLHNESRQRGYSFDRTKIHAHRSIPAIAATRGQLIYEWVHLRKKLYRRDRKKFYALPDLVEPEPHPSFLIVKGPVESWEKASLHHRKDS